MRLTRVYKLVAISSVGCGTLTAVSGLAFWWLVMPFTPVGEPQLVAASALGEHKAAIVQWFTGTGDPYRVSLYYQHSGSDWLEYYLDHEALYWRARLVPDESSHSVLIVKGGAAYGRLDLANRLLTTYEKEKHWTRGPKGKLSASDSPRAFLEREVTDERLADSKNP